MTMNTDEKHGKADGEWWADQAVEEAVNDALVDDATDDAQRDLWNRTGANPELTEPQERYVEAFTDAFAAEFRRLYPAAYAAAYKEAYKTAYAGGARATRTSRIGLTANTNTRRGQWHPAS